MTSNSQHIHYKWEHAVFFLLVSTHQNSFNVHFDGIVNHGKEMSETLLSLQLQKNGNATSRYNITALDQY